MCEGLEEDAVTGVCRRERTSRQGLESGEKGEKEVRKEEMVESGMDIVGGLVPGIRAGARTEISVRFLANRIWIGE